MVGSMDIKVCREVRDGIIIKAKQLVNKRPIELVP